MINQATIELIKRWEGCRLKAYQDVVGIWTVGWGLTSGAGFIEVGPDTVLTQDEADWYLEKAVSRFAAQIEPLITRPINENQFGAFVSLAYNIGVGGFSRSSALRHFNNGDLDRVPRSMRLWNKAGGKIVKGLVNRRNDEVQLFLTPAPIKERAPEPKKPRANIVQSKTAQATAVQAASAAGAGITAVSALDGTAQLVLIGCLALVVIASMWIFKERLRKWRLGDK